MAEAEAIREALAVLLRPMNGWFSTGQAAERLGVSIPTLKCTVADFLHDEDNAMAMIVAMGRRLMDDQGAEALVLGCGATTGLAPRVARELGIPVLDPGLTAVKYAEMLVDLGLSQSKRAYPYNPRVMQLLAGLAAGSA